MKICATIDSQDYLVDSQNSFSIAIPLRFNLSQPNPHGASIAISEAQSVPGMIGDTRQGGAVNWEKVEMTPHSNGTHTECVGHISRERVPLHPNFSEIFVPSTLVSITPELATETNESYHPYKDDEDLLITRKSLEQSLRGNSPAFCRGIIIRTLPNDQEKQERNYLDTPPPYFSLEAMRYLLSLGMHHLLVDLPSVDRASDEGKLAIHRLFWNISLGSHELTRESHLNRTITEMIFVPDEVKDGIYLTNIQIPSFMNDAAPSRPFLLSLTEKVGA